MARHQARFTGKQALIKPSKEPSFGAQNGLGDRFDRKPRLGIPSENANVERRD
jgi:hypothetical protein